MVQNSARVCEVSREQAELRGQDLPGVWVGHRGGLSEGDGTRTDGLNDELGLREGGST